VTAVNGPYGEQGNRKNPFFVRLIAAQLAPDSGSIFSRWSMFIDYHVLNLYKVRKKSWALLFQSGALFSDLSVMKTLHSLSRKSTAKLDASAIREVVAQKIHRCRFARRSRF